MVLSDFFEKHSIQGLSDDTTVKLENGKAFRLHELKTKKIRDIPDEFVPNKNQFGKDDTLVGKGFVITYEMLDNFDKKPSNGGGNWKTKFRFGK